MKYFYVFTILAALLAIAYAGILPGENQDSFPTLYIRARRGGCDFYGCQRFCHNSGDGTGPKGGGVCIKNQCDCSVVPKD
ncbi:hypothetical protein B5X24_HaOG207764 [Helicoverpa armigera]|nr:hypothetical protein B5X24_HaOG207764 [Helicoverpa armigera]